MYREINTIQELFSRNTAHRYQPQECSKPPVFNEECEPLSKQIHPLDYSAIPKQHHRHMYLAIVQCIGKSLEIATEIIGITDEDFAAVAQRGLRVSSRLCPLPLRSFNEHNQEQIGTGNRSSLTGVPNECYQTSLCSKYD